MVFFLFVGLNLLGARELTKAFALPKITYGFDGKTGCRNGSLIKMFKFLVKMALILL